MNTQETPITKLSEQYDIYFDELSMPEDTAQEGEKGLSNLIAEAQQLNNELVAVLIMLNKYKEEV